VRAVDAERERIFVRPADLVAFLARNGCEDPLHERCGCRGARD
jgi:hypothetical protein